MLARTQEVPYRPKGAALELFFCRDPEVLIEGPAGTGKTRAVLEYCYWIATAYPGVRIAWLRKTRESLTESVLVTWEQKVLPNGMEEPCVDGTATAAHRKSYTFPFDVQERDGHTYAGQSHIVLGGMDKWSRKMSTEFDIICLFEAHEFEEEDYEALLTRNRNFHLPWQQVISDTNPAHNQHWLHLRSKKRYVVPPDLVGILPAARRGQTQITRLLSRHWENPVLWEGDRDTGRWSAQGAAYMRKLKNLTGPRYKRLVDGEWVPSEGQIWPEFDSSRHMVYRQRLGPDDRPIFDGHQRNERGELVCDWYFASVDWGFRAPGCLQIWGVIGSGYSFERMYRVHEIYRVGKQLDWWCEAAVHYDRMYGLQAVVVDPSRPDLKATMNDRLGEFRHRPVAHVCVDAINSKEAGWDMVRYGLEPGGALERHANGEPVPRMKPRIYLCWEALEEADPQLKAAHKPTSTEDEILGYVWKETLKGKQVKEENDPTCADHGCDAMRYAAMFAWGRDLTPEARKSSFGPTTMGYVCGHDDVNLDGEGRFHDHAA